MMKKLIAICCFSALGVVSFAQNGTVIRAKKTTDPNYEKNLKKSEQVRKQLQAPKAVVVKDRKYYENRLDALDELIKEAKQYEMEGFDQPKLPGYIEERDSIKEKLKSL